MNQRLDQPPALDESFSRHMGLYAVSHLAARHGVRVRLRRGSPQGLSALVWLPHTLVRYERVSPADVRGTGQQRSFPLSRNGGQPPAAGQAARPGRRTMLWFTAKHPSDRRSQDETVISEASATSGRAAAEPEAVGQWTGYNAGPPASRGASPPGLPARDGLTARGLPRRTPGSNAYPGSGTADPAGLRAREVPPTREGRLPILAGPRAASVPTARPACSRRPAAPRPRRCAACCPVISSAPAMPCDRTQDLTRRGTQTRRTRVERRLP